MSNPKKFLSSPVEKMMTPTKNGSVVEDTEDEFKEIRKRLTRYKILQNKIGFDAETKKQQLDGLFERIELFLDAEIERKIEQHATELGQIRISMEDNNVELCREFLESKSLIEIKSAIDKIKDIENEEDRNFMCTEIKYELTKLRRVYKSKQIMLPQPDGSLEVLKVYEEELKQKMEYTTKNRETFEQLDTRHSTSRKLSLTIAQDRTDVTDQLIKNCQLQLHKLDDTLSKNKKVFIHGLPLRARIEKEKLLKVECLEMSKHIEFKTHEDVCTYIQTPIPVPATTRGPRKILGANGEATREGEEDENEEDHW